MKELGDKLILFFEGQDTEAVMSEWDEAADEIPRKDCFVDV